MSQPPPAGSGGTADGPADAAHHVDQPGVHALDRQRGVREQRGDGVGGRRHVRVAEDDEHGCRRDRDQPHGGAEQRRDGPLRADQRLGQVGALLGQQVLQGVAGDLPAEAAQLGPQDVEVPRTRASRPGTTSSAPAPERASNRRPVPSTTSSASTLSAVRPYATARGPHALLPIIPPSVARACVDGSGPNRRPCGAAAFCRLAITTPGSMRAVRASGSMSRMRFTCREKSSTTPVPTALPATEVPPPRAVSGTPERPGDLERGEHVVGVLRERHDLRDHAVVRRVRGVLGPAAGAVVDRPAQRGPQRLHDVGAAHALCHGLGHGHHGGSLPSATGSPAHAAREWSSPGDTGRNVPCVRFHTVSGRNARAMSALRVATVSRARRSMGPPRTRR